MALFCEINMQPRLRWLLIRELDCIREELQWEREMWLWPITLTYFHINQIKERMCLRYQLDIFNARMKKRLQVRSMLNCLLWGLKTWNLWEDSNILLKEHKVKVIEETYQV